MNTSALPLGCVTWLICTCVYASAMTPSWVWHDLSTHFERPCTAAWQRDIARCEGDDSYACVTWLIKTPRTIAHGCLDVWHDSFAFVTWLNQTLWTIAHGCFASWRDSCVWVTWLSHDCMSVKWLFQTPWIPARCCLAVQHDSCVGGMCPSRARSFSLTQSLSLSRAFSLSLCRTHSLALSLSRSLALSLPLSHTCSIACSREFSALTLSLTRTHTLSLLRARARSLSLDCSLALLQLTHSLPHTHTHLSLYLARALSLSVSRLLARSNTALSLPLSLTWLVAIGEGPRRDPGRTFKNPSCTRPCYFWWINICNTRGKAASHLAHIESSWRLLCTYGEFVTCFVFVTAHITHVRYLASTDTRVESSWRISCADCDTTYGVFVPYLVRTWRVRDVFRVCDIQITHIV